MEVESPDAFAEKKCMPCESRVLVTHVCIELERTM